MEESKQMELAQKLQKAGFSDAVDVSPEISLFEYGIIRNPKTEETILTYPSYVWEEMEKEIMFDSFTISLEEVKETLEEMEKGFFDFIGSYKEREIKNLNNEYLTNMIQSIRDYNGTFPFSPCYSVEVIERREQLEKIELDVVREVRLHDIFCLDGKILQVRDINFSTDFETSTGIPNGSKACFLVPFEDAKKGTYSNGYWLEESQLQEKIERKI